MTRSGFPDGDASQSTRPAGKSGAADSAITATAGPTVGLRQSSSHPASAARDLLATFRGVDDQGVFARNLQTWKTAAIDPHRLPRYRVIQRIGHGSQGLILSVADRDCRREVALKVLRAGPDDRLDASRFIHEAQITAQLEHPGIVPVHDLDVLPDGTIFYTMKKVEGRTLAELLGEGSRADHPVPTSHKPIELQERNHLLRIMLQVCDTMAFAHSRGVIHRDLKPRNLMVGRFGEVLVMDWGLAKILDQTIDERPVVSLRTLQVEDGDDSQATLDGSAIGTPAFMSPEQARGEVSDRRSDIYSLGVILYHCLCGESPYMRGRVRATLEQVAHGRWTALDQRPAGQGLPKRLLAIVHTAMALDPQQRYDSVEALAQDLRSYLDGAAVHAYHESIFDRVARLAIARRQMLFIVLVTVTVAGFVAGSWFWRESSLRDDRLVTLRRSAAQHELMGELDAARRDLELFLDQRPDDRLALEAQQRVRQAILQRTDDLLAVRRHQEAAQLDVTASKAAAAGDLATAIEQLSLAIQLEPDSERKRRRSELTVRQDEEERRAHRKEHLAEADSWLERGRQALAKNDLSQARECVSMARALNSEHPGLAVFVAAVEQRQEQLATQEIAALLTAVQSHLAQARVLALRQAAAPAAERSALQRQRGEQLAAALADLRHGLAHRPADPRLGSAIAAFHRARLAEANAANDAVASAVAIAEIRVVDASLATLITAGAADLAIPSTGTPLMLQPHAGGQSITLQAGDRIRLAAGGWRITGPCGLPADVTLGYGQRLQVDWPRTLPAGLRFVPGGESFLGGELLPVGPLLLREELHSFTFGEGASIAELVAAALVDAGPGWRVPTSGERLLLGGRSALPEVVHDESGWWVTTDGFSRQAVESLARGTRGAFRMVRAP